LKNGESASLGYQVDLFDLISGETRGINNKGDIVGRAIILLKPDTTYYWRVDEKIDECLTKGDIWEFTTDPNMN